MTKRKEEKELSELEDALADIEDEESPVHEHGFLKVKMVRRLDVLLYTMGRE